MVAAGLPVTGSKASEHLSQLGIIGYERCQELITEPLAERNGALRDVFPKRILMQGSHRWATFRRSDIPLEASGNRIRDTHPG